MTLILSHNSSGDHIPPQREGRQLLPLLPDLNEVLLSPANRGADPAAAGGGAVDR